MLHNDNDLFERVVLDTSEKYGIVPVIIEKDYYVTAANLANVCQADF